MKSETELMLSTLLVTPLPLLVKVLLSDLPLLSEWLFSVPSLPDKKNPKLDYPLCENDIKLTDPMIFSGLIIGAMLPYAFSAMTMKSVGLAAFEMVTEIRRQLREDP
jgi:Na+/H+-translocating membrane pyrophosphatase